MVSAGPTGAPDSRSNAPSARPPTTVDRIVFAVFAVLLVVLVVAAILFDEAALVISIVLAFLAVAISIRIWRIIRRGRWWSRALLGVAILTVLCGGLVVEANLRGSNPAVRPAASIRYRASGTVDDQTITLHEELFYDSAFLTHVSAAISRPNQQITADEVTIQGWTVERTLDGYPVYSNTEYGDVSSSSPIRDRVTMPISVGDATVTLPDGHVYTVGVVPAEGSELRLTAPRSAISAISPPASERADLPDNQELIVVPVATSDEVVSADVLKPFMRHPIGLKINEVFASGILPAVEWFALTAVFAALRQRLTAYTKHVLTGWLRRRNKRDRGGPAQATTEVSGADGGRR